MPKRLLILYFCLYLSMIGYGLSLPLLPFFLQEITKYQELTPAKVSLHVGAVTAMFAFMQMIFAPLWGRLSDRTSRRKYILLLGLAGYTMSLALAGLSKNIGMLYGARMLNGIFSAAVLPIASAYIVDVTPENYRARGLAWHGTSVGLGVVSGPAVGSLFSDLVARHPFHLDFININAFSAPFLLASLLSAFSVIVAGILLPESYPRKTNISAHETDMKPASWYKVYMKNAVTACLLLSLTSQFALSLFEGTFVLHAQNVMDINAVQLGYVFMVCGFVMAVAQGTIVAGFIEKLGAVKMLPFGFFFMGGGLVALMAGRSMNSILLFVGILAFGMAIITPSIAVLISLHAEGRLGKNLGLLAGVNSFGQTLGPLIGSLLFVINIHLPYLLTAGVLFVAASYGLLKNNVLQK